MSSSPIPSSAVAQPSSILSLARLVRLPNVFSAIADILVGYGIVHAAGPGPDLYWLIASSASLYLSGMVWNDIFDIEIDRRERPRRPLPSGAISVYFATVLAVFLMAVGGACASMTGRGSSIAIAVLLILAILAYDGWAKKTWFGPDVMGLCRGLNVLLGMSPIFLTLPDSVDLFSRLPYLWTIPLANCLYIIGVTHFARDEAGSSRKVGLIQGAVLMAGGLLLHAITVGFYGHWRFAAFVAGLVFAFTLGRLILAAIGSLQGPSVQRAVKSAIFGLVIVDAVVALAFRGPILAAVILSLLIPALYLGRRIYST